MDVRQDIMDTARDIFLEKGYKGTKILDITQALQISPSTIYIYFSGKKDLFDSLDIPQMRAYDPKYDEKRTSIVYTALLLFGEHGYDKTTMNMIAKEVGISKTSIYQYFDDKEDLFATVMKETSFHINFLNNQSTFKSTDFISSILEVVGYYMSMFKIPEHNAFTKTIINKSSTHPEITNMLYKHSLGFFANCIKDVLDKNRNLIRDDITDTYLVAKTYVGSIFNYCIQYKIMPGLAKVYTDHEYIYTSTDIFLRGVLKDTKNYKLEIKDLENFNI